MEPFGFAFQVENHEHTATLGGPQMRNCSVVSHPGIAVFPLRLYVATQRVPQLAELLLFWSVLKLRVKCMILLSKDLSSSYTSTWFSLICCNTTQPAATTCCSQPPSYVDFHKLPQILLRMRLMDRNKAYSRNMASQRTLHGVSACRKQDTEAG